MLRGLWVLLSMTGIPRLIMRLMLDGRVPFRLKLLLPAAILYVIVPFDIVPDFFLLPGRIDDLIVLVGAGLVFLLSAPRDVLMEHSGQQPPAQDSRKRNDGEVIDGEYRRLDE